MTKCDVGIGMQMLSCIFQAKNGRVTLRDQLALARMALELEDEILRTKISVFLEFVESKPVDAAQNLQIFLDDKFGIWQHGQSNQPEFDWQRRRDFQ